ncbi:MAG TPA: alkaline phosphatase family protein [Candidatus Binatia bacterium]|jgi:phospholipase C
MAKRTRKTRSSKARAAKRAKQNASKDTRRRKKAAKVRQTRQARRATRFAAVPPDPGLDNLNKIQNIVVVMLENRSFDHMVGYLKLEENWSEVEGLTSGLSNSDGTKNYPIHHLASTAFKDNQDPCHSGACVSQQLQDHNGGFVRNYVATYPADPDRGLVMGYYNGTDLPVYDHLAVEFTVCDHWFSSVPGATWPNRLYAVTGRADKSKDNKSTPIYNIPSFVRHLDANKVTWTWYSDNYLFGFYVPTLALTDKKYRWGGNYGFLDDFYKQAAAGTLPSVAWIDPIFVATRSVADANDDHPPADVRHGQDLILTIYHALASNPDQWKKTLLVIMYDEHGGLYDHVPPPAAEDDDATFRSYGVRVPAFLVSPWVAQKHVSKTVFDHTSLIKTILLRFCRRPDGSIPDMGKRVMAANHLGDELSEAVARPAPSIDSYHRAVAALAEWYQERSAARFQPDHLHVDRPEKLNEFQEGLIRAAKQLEKERPKGQANPLPRRP